MKVSRIRNRHILVVDTALLVFAAILSFGLRFDQGLQPRHWRMVAMYLFAALPVKLLAFFYMGLYRRFWIFASVNDLLLIVFASTSAAALVLFLHLAVVLPTPGIIGFPRSIPIIDWLLTVAFVGGIRFSICWLARRKRQIRKQREHRPEAKNVLIMGAGNSGALIGKEMLDNPQLGLTPLGFVDDDPSKLGLSIHDIVVLGNRSDIPRLVVEHVIHELIIAMPSAPGKAIRDVLEICQSVALPARTVPGIHELLSGDVSVRQIRDINIQDLLRREPVRTNMARIRQMIQGSRVLVTGGGGSIGGELCRQICRFEPELLVFLGHGENSIFGIEQEMKRRFPDARIHPVIADIRDRTRLNRIFELYEPELVFHTAAHKHVPLMEANEEEAVMNNVLGTRNLVELAAQRKDTRLVLISSDKAVNPTSVMGATKRVAELVTQSVAREHGACFSVVRFGNVLGSRGSVLNIFREQIASGGPITVTDPEMRRYFMTIPEAVQLVLQAASLATCGEVFVLDMGEPVKIVDLATDLVRLYGLQPGRDIEITFTGIRPGEKLFEELFVQGEEYHRTEHEKIFVVANHELESPETLYDRVDELIAAAQAGRPDEIRRLISLIEPSYQPLNQGGVATTLPGASGTPVGGGLESQRAANVTEWP